MLAARAAWAAAPFEADERRMAEMVNAERAERKLAKLEYHPGLAGVARAHSLDMREHGFFAHESKRTGKVKDRLAKAKMPARAAGENLAKAKTVKHAHTNLMNSPPHRKNILNPELTHVGIGIVRNDKGQLLVTQVFMRTVPICDPSEVRERLLAAINEARLKKGLRRLVADERLGQLAQAHSERAKRLGRPEPQWLHRQMKAGGRKWRLLESGYFLTDKLAQVVQSSAALGRAYDHCGIGVAQTAPSSESHGALWITLVCAQK